MTSALSFTTLCLALAGLACTAATLAQPLPLEHVVVTADFRERAVEEIPSSVTVLDAAVLDDAAVQHFEEVLPLAPNLSWAGGSSRPRYFQLRGVGELEQYEGAPNPSVGFLIDNIDFSGIGMVATLFDVEQVEILRGPQGTRYGSGALGGMINLRTRGPGERFEASAELTGGTDDAVGGGLAFGGPVGAAAGYRLAFQRQRSDGFRNNRYLDRDDTNGRDETTARGRLTFAGGDWDLDATVLLADLDNGYDAFAIDNSLTTLSDKPGRDAQRSLAAGVSAAWRPGSVFELQSVTTAADSRIEHSFDGDWGNDQAWGIHAPYDFTSASDRTRTTVSQELRLLSLPGGVLFGGTTDWLVGVYALRLDDTNVIRDLFNGEVFRALDSDYRATNTAIFGELDAGLTDTVAVAAGLRVEHRDARYHDSAGARFSPGETMSGGHVSLTWAADANRSYYLKIARGYKAGGFNIDISIPPAQRRYDTESLWNFEAGVRAAWMNESLTTQLSLFHMRRQDQQVRTSRQLDPGDPLSFVFFTDNAARGTNRGLEASAAWRVGEGLALRAALGLLDTRFDDYQSDDGRSLVGREQAHAPGYQYSLGASYRHAGGFAARLDLSGTDAFYYSDSHDQRSRAYRLVNGRIGYEADRWGVWLWGRNLFDETYTVRGFFFGNEPPDFQDTLYTRQGDPRQVGVTLTYRY